MERLKHASTPNQKKAYKLEIDIITKTVDSSKPTHGNGGDDSSEEERKEAERVAKDAEKRRLKAIEDAKRHAAELLKIETDLQKQLLDTQRSAEDLKIALVSDDFQRERQLLNTEYDRKIADVLANVKREQDEIAKLRASLANSKTSDSDRESFQRQLDARLQLLAAFNQSAISLEQSRSIKLA